MLRQPRSLDKTVLVRKDNKGRFQIKPLEDRIAPRGSKYHTDQGNHYGQYK